MINALKDEIIKSLDLLAQKAANQPLENLIEPLEEVYEKLLIADYLEKRLERRQRMQKRLIHSLQDQIEVTDTGLNLPEEIEDAPSNEVNFSLTHNENTFNAHPEIVVVPHPEGPPAMRIEQEEPLKHMPVETAVDAIQHQQPQQAAVEMQATIASLHAEPVAEVIPPVARMQVAEKPLAKPEVPQPVPAPKVASTIAEKAQSSPKKASLHEKLASKTLNFGLNDRIAFVKHLFEGNTDDFNRVVGQLNTFESWEEAENFVTEMVKPDYNWNGKEEYEGRFLASVKAKFD